MTELENRERREEIFSEIVRAGKRTYFFDVKETRNGERYLTITESKRRFNNDSGQFFYEKHKLFLYQEDFDKFSNGLKSVFGFIETGKAPEIVEKEVAKEEVAEDEAPKTETSDISFEDLGIEDTKTKD
ncbi:MAG: hypothetical protein B6D64_05810 [Bacteroidetes bacterium 4484_276]|nr:MAG: hypothetical protein B6D64_05810 [Bacteroidetes bacterium 4484_276]OYT14045.1 MAG: DNA-binding protein [Bacteroidetes bacterium 4572_114]